MIGACRLGACRVWGVEAKIGPSEDSFCQVRRLIAIAMGQEADEKWTAAVNLQPTLPKPDRLLDTAVGRARAGRDGVRWQGQAQVCSAAFGQHLEVGQPVLEILADDFVHAEEDVDQLGHVVGGAVHGPGDLCAFTL